MSSPESNHTLSWDEFERVDLRAGTITRAEPFPEAHTPAYKLWIDFGDKMGPLPSSAQITDRYDLDELEGRQVLGVVNFPPKQIGPFVSECLVTGFVLDDDEVVLAEPDAPVPNGTRLA